MELCGCLGMYIHACMYIERKYLFQNKNRARIISEDAFSLPLPTGENASSRTMLPLNLATKTGGR